jgi:hypothetical protein
MNCRISTFLCILLAITGLMIIVGPGMVQALELQPVASVYMGETGGAKGVAISGNIAYVAAEYDGIKLYDITDPANPLFVGGCSTPGSANNIFVRGNYAYVANGDSGLQIIDVSIPAAPVIIGRYETPDGVPGTGTTVILSGDYAYLADGYRGLLIINIADPVNPSLAGTFNNTAYIMGVALAGNLAYITANFISDSEYGQLQAIDISDPANPTFVDGVSYGFSDYGVSISGDYAYVGANTYGMGIFNISNPGHPTFAGAYDVLAPGSVKRTFATDTLAFFANGEGGFMMLNISNPISPVLIDSVNTFGLTTDVIMSGDYVYVSDGTTLEIYSISTVIVPTCQYVVGDANSSGGFNGVDVVFAVSYFKGGAAPAYECECTPGHSWFVAGDVNASCNFNGVDVTYMVTYFKGGPGPLPCPDCLPGR